MHNIAPAISEEDFRLPNQATNVHIQPESKRESKHRSENADNSVLAFLKDIQQYPDSGIASRYKRLDISVRQGQKLKAKILQQTLIEEHIKTTNTGRLKLIRLTEKGKAALSGAN